jgi:hypothetical protein
MQDSIQVPGNVDEGRHIRTHQSEPVAFEKVFNVAGIASREVVETDDFVAFIQQALTEVRSEKPGPSSHSSASEFHGAPLPLEPSRTTAGRSTPGL